MEKGNCYIYPAILTYEPQQEISVVFPDLNCATSGVDEKDAINSARELLECVLCGLKADNEDIPKPTNISDIKLKSNEKAVLIDFKC
ncbi:MAG: type II toxin-antitoxin system HicB family antitoxin [Tyzzerella sp.]|uniref:Type II toxin-antitoxin system HicB family antitoxin n=1 Tax=Candidatus Fimicola merdigallinarum TaxID=2840819 RepID=A0A9D9DXZ3_9FIRM|nr:type II toxin-antitoxin system HicB family antitoxin [Candidatus Fimicola merdigallinarum]